MRAPDELRKICKKISLAYKIRQESLSRRRSILAAMEKSHAMYATERLKALLWKERKLLDLLIEDEKFGMTLINYARQIITKEIEKGESILADDKIIFEDELEAYFQNIMILLGKLEKNAEHTRNRMNVELQMLKHNSNAHVKRFISLWNLELEENAKLVKFFHATLARQRPIQKKILSLEAHYIREAGILASLAMVMGVLKSFLDELEPAFA